MESNKGQHIHLKPLNPSKKSIVPPNLKTPTKSVNFSIYVNGKPLDLGGLSIGSFKLHNKAFLLLFIIARNKLILKSGVISNPVFTL